MLHQIIAITKNYYTYSTYLLPLGPSKHRLALGTAVEKDSIQYSEVLLIFGSQTISQGECTVTGGGKTIISVSDLSIFMYKVTSCMAIDNFHSLGVLTFTTHHKQLCALHYVLYPSHTNDKNLEVLQHPQAPTCLWALVALLLLYNVTYTFHQFENNGHIGT